MRFIAMPDRWPVVASKAWPGRPDASARFPKFVTQGSTLLNEFRKAKGTSKSMILVPLFDLKFLIEIAAGGAGTSNRRH
jgi:hypothetical protein